jgi:hypothetical protein
MLIGVAHRFVLLTSPYTGAGPLERLLTPYAEINRVGSDRRQQISLRDLRREYHFLFGQKQWDLETFYTWGLLRAPVDWVWTAYRQSAKAHAQLMQVQLSAPSVEAAFRQWWAADPLGLRQQPQFARFQGLDGQCGLNAVVPVPVLNQVVPRVLVRLGIPAQLDGLAGKAARVHAPVPEDLADEIRRHFRQDEALFQQWMAHWSADDETPCRLEIEVCPCAGVQEARLLPPPSVAPTHQVQPTLHGAVVMQHSPAEQLQLRLEGDEGLQGQVHGHLPSQWLATQYPQLPQAAQARLEIRGLRLKAGQSARVLLIAAGGPQTLFRLRMVAQG